MSSKIKQKIAQNVYNVIQNKSYQGHFEDLFGWFKLVKENENKILWQISLPLNSKSTVDSSSIVDSQNGLLESKIVKHINSYSCGRKYDVELDIKHLIKDVLDSNPISLNFKPLPKKVIVEFSSPNIAKPFHVGHLRSTVIGNCLANIKKKLGKDVIKMNYLGDWGTQFGMIQVGMGLENYSEEELEKDPIKKMYTAYVRGNREAELNVDIYEQAKKVFSDLELGEEKVTQSWNKYKKWTIQEFSASYERIGVSFDEYEWESDYKRKEADKILEMLKEKGVLRVDEKGRMTATVGDNIIPLVKSDNTTLYILRDLMAIPKRRSKHKFDELYYVVENGQSKHFQSLFSLCKELNFDEGVLLKHVRFGRIQGMSTRKGKSVFLTDILDEAQQRCYEKQAGTKTTKSSLDTKVVADILGTSSIIIGDLKQHRKKDYEFSWESCLNLKGQSGLQLQYCHCRLCSLEENCGVTPAAECDPEALLEPEAIDLVLELARFEEVLCHTNNELEPCVLTFYLFRLTRAINIAFKFLAVKHSAEHVAGQRLLLFKKSREVLCEGMKLLGLKPLTKM